MGPQPPFGPTDPARAVPVLTLAAEFTIDSPVGTVTGHKEMSVPLVENGICQEFEDRPPGFYPEGTGHLYFLNTDQSIRYEARILTRDGRLYADRGVSRLTVDSTLSDVPDVSVQQFSEDLFSESSIQPRSPHRRKFQTGQREDADECKRPM